MACLGIDVGSLFVSLVLVDGDGRMLRHDYIRHHGEPRKVLRGALARYPLAEIEGAACTGSSGRNVPGGLPCYDPVVAGVEAARRLAPDARNLIQIGGGSFSLTELDAHGRYRKSTLNSACAAGTGAFLDQQALRLQVPPNELAERAMSYPKRPPAVATRCAVFAKSDMIHLQQEGFTVEAIAAGLCAGLGRSTVDGLLDGHKLEGKTALLGGVARNTVVAAAVREQLGTETEVVENPELAGAYGAALLARSGPKPDFSWLDRAEEEAAAPEASNLRPPLALELSKYPDFRWADHWVNEDGSEIAVVALHRGRVPVSLGVDIGSTSTKGIALDEKNEVVGWVYRKTAGNPIRAVQLLLKAFREMQERGGFSLEVRGVGTTGSGRRMIGAVIGADLAVNEITAHAAAAVFLDPQVDTILELGGQDAKFTQLQNGMVYNSVMNYVCAAGTGSFIEEQALKLGIPLAEFADRALGLPCPRTSDRCTVYMERDLDLLLARGWSKDQVAAAVLHSVRDNYLNKVVNGMHIGEHVYFQGATARNKALVAAFECELGVPIQVSPYCHLTGALGMALLVRERVPAGRRSERFKGFDFADAKVSVEYEVCELCHNRCNLSLIRTGGETVAWGLKCGRDYADRRVKAKKAPGFDAWKAREAIWAAGGRTPGTVPAVPASGKRPRVGILRSLGTYGYYPFWAAFLESLGCEPVLSSRTTETTFKHGVEIATAEYCAPVLAGLGHARDLIERQNIDFLFAPYMIREPLVEGFTDSHFCAYVQAHPAVLGSIRGLGEARLLTPVVQFSLPEDYQVAKLAEALCGPLKVDRERIREALRAGVATHRAFRESALALGREAVRKAEEADTLALVCIGRPYNTVDAGLTLDLPRKMAELGYPVLYMDMLPWDAKEILPEHANMYWHYGQKILAAATHVARERRLFGVYFTNFMCGPDSYILTYFKEIMGKTGKPYLVLQFDGHGADAGYLTRVEAALESFHSWSGIPRPPAPAAADE